MAYDGHMKKTNISILKRDLSRFIQHVRQGGVVRVFDRNTPVAEIVPLAARAGSENDATAAMLERLERQGTVVRRGSGRIDPALLRKPALKIGASVAEAIVEERRDGR